MGDNFTRYRDLALQTNASGLVLDSMLDTRVLVKDYVILPSVEKAELVEARAAETMEYILELETVVDTDEKAALASEIHGDLDRYITTFRKVVELQNSYMAVLTSDLGPIATEIGDNVASLVTLEQEKGNRSGTAIANEILREYLLARIEVNRFMEFYNSNVLELVSVRLDSVDQLLTQLIAAVEDQESINLTNNINRRIVEYRTGVTQLISALTERNNTINNTLDLIGPEIANELAEFNAGVKAEQDILGPQMAEMIEFETTTTLVLSIVALLLGGAFSIFVGRNITLPIVKMKNVMEALSKDDLDIEIPGLGRNDEIGQMATAVQIFKENAIRMRSNSSQIFSALQSTDNINDFCREAIRQITPLMDGGHGAFYTYDKKEKELSLTGSYGYKDRKEFSNRFGLGQGLIGQCALELETITLTTVPDDYIKITSGLGSASPKAVIATPVTHQGKLLGVIEVASFKEFDETSKRVLEELLTVLGLTMENIIRSERTATLLETSTAQAEALLQNEAELKASEEEMQASNEELMEKTKLLEQQAQALRASEEEARTTNEEFIEKSHILQKQQETLKDVSEENANRATELEESNKYKSEFLANMSHELRTPLNSLLILSKSLADNNDGDLNDDSIEAATIIHSSGEQLLHLINDILDLSKIEAGRVETTSSASDIRDLMHMAERKFNHMADEKSIDFSIEIADDVPSDFVTDIPKADQIITNLIGNAIKFTDAGSVKVEVSTETDDMTRQLIISVTDTGCGIPDLQQNTVFEAFRQADGSSSRKYGGTGLGLSISKNLSEILNGDIDLESIEDEGSKFTLTLNEMELGDKGSTSVASKPIKAPKAKKIVKKTAIEKVKLEPFIEDDRHEVTEKSQCILVIEDKEKFAKVLRDDVRSRGILSIVVKNGKDALKICNSHVPSGIIMDKNVPEMDNEEFSKQLKSNAKTRNIPVHFITQETSKDENSEDDSQATQEDINKALDMLIPPISDEQRKILVVEDDKGSAIAIQKLISADNISIDVATTGKDAKKKVTNNEYDCVILDLTLPDMDGMEVLKKMASLNKNKNELLPVIVYSGRDLEMDMISEIKQYTDSIIVKGGRSPERLLDEVALFLHSVKETKKVESVNGTTPVEDSDMVEILKNLEGKTILAVDDDMRNTFALSRVLREKGLNLLMAQDGNKALKQLDEHNSIAAVLMDIMMPVMDGYETIGEIRKQDKFKNLPIIALTAKAMKGDKEKCLDAGANSYLAKPIDIDLLLRELNELIGK